MKAKDGTYRAVLYGGKVVAGFTIKDGKVRHRAPILRRQVNADGTMSAYVLKRSELIGTENISTTKGGDAE